MQPRGVKMSALPAMKANQIQQSQILFSVADVNTEIWALEPRYCINPKDLEAGKNYSQIFKQQEQTKEIKNEIYGSLKKKDALTDLENFQDLTNFCLSTTKAQIMDTALTSGELNTPEFELDEFGFIQATSNDNSEFDDLQKTENHLTRVTSEFDNSFMIKQEQPFAPKMEQPIFTNNNILLHNSGGSIIENNNNTMLNSTWSNINSCENTSTIAIDDIQNAEVIFSNEIVGNYVIKHEINKSLEVTDTTEQKMQLQDAQEKPKLRLDFANILPPNLSATTSIDTPEVIRNALSLEQDEFNLVNFINAAEIEQENSVEDSCSTLNDDTISQCTSTNSFVYTDDTSDEDYEPLNKRQRKATKRSSRTISNKLNLQNEEPSLPKVVKRGRPSKKDKHHQPASSQGHGEVSRYREMRDKNNEASRKSRFNRKLKEQQLEEEANQLEEKNHRLRVQVEQLDKLVSNMRNNLMKLMLKK